MKSVKYMDEEMVIKKAMKVLIRELGPVEAIRFINIPKKRRIDSIRRHREWQKLLDKATFTSPLPVKALLPSAVYPHPVPSKTCP